MAFGSSIEWTDATWNPVRGCTKVSPGCAHCYAETFSERFRGVPGHPYEFGFDLRLVPEKLAEHCALESLHRGALVVMVDSASHLYELKQMMLGGLENQLKLACSSAGLRKVTLKPGRWYVSAAGQQRIQF